MASSSNLPIPNDRRDPRLAQVASIVALLSAMAPPAVTLVHTLVQKLQGVSADDLMAEADNKWGEAKTNAQAEIERLNQLPSAPTPDTTGA